MGIKIPLALGAASLILGLVLLCLLIHSPHAGNPRHLASREEHGLRFVLTVEEATGDGGWSLRIHLLVENVGEEAMAVWFRSGQAWDIVVEADGQEIWRWSQGKMFTQVIWSRELRPGEEVSFEAEWEAPGPGKYRIRGYFLGHIGGLDGPSLEPLDILVQVG